MEDNQKLFKDAILDAKTLQKVAMSNAKKSLEEAFGPKIESAFKSKLAEMEKKEMEEGKEEELEENTEINEMESELEEILQELGMGQDNAVFNDATHDADIEEAEESEEDEKSSESPESSEESEEEMGEEPVTDLTVSEFEGIVRSAVKDVMGGGEEAGMEGPEMGGPEGGEEMPGGDQELDLDEIMDELEETSAVYDGVDGIDEAEELEEADELDEVSELEESEELEENQELEEKKQVMKKVKEAKAALEEAKQWYNAKTKGKAVKGVPKNAGPKGFIKAKTGKTPKLSEVAKVKEELQEAISTIKTLKGTLTETNLLNAKLLYVNKLFKAKQLSENQKVKVVAAFDKARTKEEAKTIYESLNETLNNNTKKSLVKESLGFASKVIGGTKPTSKDLIVENETVKRFQKLAGII